MNGKILCLTGGIGGAKLAFGLYRVLPDNTLIAAINTGDDFTHLDLEIWPDFDTTLYTLADLAHPINGWGRADESWAFLETFAAIGGDAWFKLGDRDLALHVLRTLVLREGVAPSELSRRLGLAFGLRARLTPATDQHVRTVIHTKEGVLSFQDYFVRQRAEPVITSINYAGAENATLAPLLQQTLQDHNLRGVVIAPSNPLLSISPILAISTCRTQLRAAAPIIAVSPLIGGTAVKGPTAKIMTELGVEVSAVSVARMYQDILDGFVLDEVDAALAPQIRKLGIACHVTPTLMRNDAEKMALARSVVGFLHSLTPDQK